MLQGGDGASSRALPTGKGSFQKHLKIVWTLPWARPKCGSTGECTNSTGNAFMGLARVSCSEQSPFTGIIPSLSSATPRAAPSPAGQLSAHCAHCAVRTQPGCPVTHSGCDLWCHSCHSSTAQLSLDLSAKGISTPIQPEVHPKCIQERALPEGVWGCQGCFLELK